jgi:hypothetical protein
MPETILPGTYITVRDEGLISAGAVASGNIGIVGTASKGKVNTVQILGSFAEAKEAFGESDVWQGGTQNELTLIRALELIYNNGGKTVYAVRTASATLAKAFFTLKAGNSELLRLEAKGTPGSWGNQIKIRIQNIDSADIEGTPLAAQKRIELTYGTVQEIYELQAGGLSLLQTTLNERSSLVTTDKPSQEAGNKLPDNTVEPFASFGGGDDGAKATKDEYQTSLALLENEIINLVTLAGQDNGVPWAQNVLEAHLKITEGEKRERMGLIGSALTVDAQGNVNEDVNAIANHPFANNRLIFVAPGVIVSGRDPKQQYKLSGGYLAAAVTGLISSLPVQTSPTNKTLAIAGLTKEFSASQLEKIVQSRVLAVMKQSGFRIVKGITTDTNTAWHQVTTRRIVDYAIYGVRSACNPYIGKLNNQRVRGAMKATLNAFLTRMVDDEALVGYSVEVSATRDQEIAGEAIVTMTLKPTFSIDFIKVTMYLG